MKKIKTVKMVFLGIIFGALAFALAYFLGNNFKAFYISLAVGGISLGGLLAIWGLEAFQDGKRSIGIFQYIAAVVCILVSIGVIIIKI